MAKKSVFSGLKKGNSNNFSNHHCFGKSCHLFQAVQTFSTLKLNEWSSDRSEPGDASKFYLSGKKNCSSDKANNMLFKNVYRHGKGIICCWLTRLGQTPCCVSMRVQWLGVYLAVACHMGHSGGRLLSETTHPSLYSFHSLPHALACTIMCASV